jgi:hypothetical protein
MSRESVGVWSVERNGGGRRWYALAVAIAFELPHDGDRHARALSMHAGRWYGASQSPLRSPLGPGGPRGRCQGDTGTISHA